jgi:hypothetical protein
MSKYLLLLAIVTIALAAPTGGATCLYDCDDNPEWCDNDSYCLGPCVCSLIDNVCVPG